MGVAFEIPALEISETLLPYSECDATNFRFGHGNFLENGPNLIGLATEGPGLRSTGQSN